MAFTDITYYTGDIQLSITETLTVEFNSFIEKKEKELLIKLLGYDLYKAFTEALSGSPDQKWTDLRDGKDYQVTDENGNSVYVEWVGLQNDEKKSFLAYFIYYEWIKSTQTRNQPGGEFFGVNENSEIAPPFMLNGKVSDAYNKGVEMYGIDLEKGQYYSDWFIRGLDAPSNYKGFNYYDEILKGSAFNFIYFMNQDDPSTYPNWKFTEIRNINEFGI
jgi:hypothetical protein